MFGVQVFGTNSRFYTLLIQDLGSFLPLSFCCLTWGGAGTILRPASLYFLLWNTGPLDPVLATSGSLSPFARYQAVLLRWRLLPHFRFFTAAASRSRTVTRRASCGHTLAGPGWLRPRGPQQPCLPGLWRSYEWHDLPELGSRQSPWAWRPGKTLLEREVGRGCCTLPTSSSPWSRRPTARPIGSVVRRVAAPPWVYAALFCLVTDALETKFMT